MMGKGKVTTDSIRSNYGFNEASEQALKSIIGKSEESSDEKNVEYNSPKKRGRKKLENREQKKGYSLTLLPSTYEKAQEKAASEGRSVSEIINELLERYVK